MALPFHVSGNPYDYLVIGFIRFKDLITGINQYNDISPWKKSLRCISENDILRIATLETPESVSSSRSLPSGVPCILEADKSSKEYRKNWARLIQKIYEVDPLTCPKCRGTMRIISLCEAIDYVK